MREKGERATVFFFAASESPAKNKIPPWRYGAEREKGARATVLFLLPQNPQQKIKYCRGDLAQREKGEKRKGYHGYSLSSARKILNNGNKKFKFYI